MIEDSNIKELNIFQYGNEILRKKCEDIDPKNIANNTELQTLIKQMYKTMVNVNGAGLAAPQIGKLIKMFVANLREGTIKKQFVAINPVVEKVGDEKVLGREGCLSIKGIYENVERYKTIKLKYVDRNGNNKEGIFSDWNARIIQHETDHLYGILFVDYVKSQELEKKLEDFVKNNN